MENLTPLTGYVFFAGMDSLGWVQGRGGGGGVPISLSNLFFRFVLKVIQKLINNS